MLEKSKALVKSVVITGGEPTLQDIVPLCRRLKEEGYEIKLDTNGSSPETVGRLIEGKLVDFVALDIKGPLEPNAYSAVTGVDCTKHVSSIKKTLKILQDSGIGYECRSPIVPGLNADERSLKAQADSVRGAAVFVLEQFWPEKGTLEPRFRAVKGLDCECMRAAASFFKNPVVKIRTRESGEEVVSR